jgi:hypothetical protein
MAEPSLMFLLAFRITVPSQLAAAARFQMNAAIVFSAKGAHRQTRRGERSVLHGRLAAQKVAKLQELSRVLEQWLKPLYRKHDWPCSKPRKLTGDGAGVYALFKDITNRT